MIIHFLEVGKEKHTPRDAHTHTLTPYVFFKIHVKIGSKTCNFHMLLVPLKIRALARSTDEVPSYHLSV